MPIKLSIVDLASGSEPARLTVSVTQDNYGRWFVEAREGNRKLAPIRCLSEQEARDRARQLSVLTHDAAAA